MRRRSSSSSVMLMPPVKPTVPSITTILRWRAQVEPGPLPEPRAASSDGTTPPRRRRRPAAAGSDAWSCPSPPHRAAGAPARRRARARPAHRAARCRCGRAGRCSTPGGCARAPARWRRAARRTWRAPSTSSCARVAVVGGRPVVAWASCASSIASAVGCRPSGGGGSAARARTRRRRWRWMRLRPEEVIDHEADVRQRRQADQPAQRRHRLALLQHDPQTQPHQVAEPAEHQVQAQVRNRQQGIPGVLQDFGHWATPPFKPIRCPAREAGRSS